MAFTVVSTIVDNERLPAGYTKPTLPSLAGTTQKSNFTTNIAKAGIPNVDPEVGVAALLTAVDSYVSGTFLTTVLGLDALLDIDVNVTVNKVTPTSTVDNIFETGTDQYQVRAIVEYVVN